MKIIASMLFLSLSFAVATTLAAETFTTIYDFNDGPNGSLPSAAMTQGSDGNLYGTTYGGGAHGQGGTIFRLAPDGVLTTLYSFCSQPGCTDGKNPTASLVQATGGDFYGTTYYGGSGNGGVVFRITTGGVLTTLYSFCTTPGCPDGEGPSGLIQAANGDLYGTTFFGGSSYNGGTIFSITVSGALTTVYSFCTTSKCRDGRNPGAGVVETADGGLYGTTTAGGAYNGGSIFRISPGSPVKSLHSFCPDGCTDGEGPNALIRAADGDFYGATVGGGAGDGTVFKITAKGAFTSIHTFCLQNGCPDGAGPTGLIQAKGGSFYGTTYGGGSDGSYGTIFEITPAGVLTTLHIFHFSDGAYPGGPVVQAASGDFYGTTINGGASATCPLLSTCGTIFSLALDANPNR